MLLISRLPKMLTQGLRYYGATTATGAYWWSKKSGVMSNHVEME